MSEKLSFPSIEPAGKFPEMPQDDSLKFLLETLKAAYEAHIATLKAEIEALKNLPVRTETAKPRPVLRTTSEIIRALEARAVKSGFPLEVTDETR